MLDVPQLRGTSASDDQHLRATRLVCLENTTNMSAEGRAYPLEQIGRVGAWAHENGLKVHVDGARLFNAVVARGYSPKDVGTPRRHDLRLFLEGTGLPDRGSILVGSTEEIRMARRVRKLFGGALRQAGIVAAAAELCAGTQCRTVGRGPSRTPGNWPN